MGIIDYIASKLALQPPEPKKPLKHTKYIYLNGISSIDNRETISYKIYKKDSVKYLIFSHGNACDMNQMDEFCKTLSENLNVNIVSYDYRGYGNSFGNKSLDNCCKDLRYVYRKILKLTNKENIYLMGQSIGTGIVIDYLSKHRKYKNPSILISPYKSLLSIISNSNYKMLDHMVSINKIKKIKSPIKIYHGTKDDIIDVEHSKELYDKLINKKYD